jgi:hypothetical protein
MKHADALHYAMEDYMETYNLELPDEMDLEEKEERIYQEKERIKEMLDQYFQFGEYVTLVLDTETGTMTVEKQRSY